MSQYFIGIACFTFGTAFVQALVSEVPFVRLEKLLLGGSARPQKPKIETEKSNGHANVAAKGQLISKGLFDVSVLTKKTMFFFKDSCPSL